MEKRLILLGLFISLVFFGGTAFARTSGIYPMGRPFEATSLIGQRVNGRGGDYMGQITNLVADQSNDRVALVVLSDIPGLGSKKVAIPYGSLQRTGKYTFEVNFSSVPHIGLGSADSSKDLDLYFLTRAPKGSDLYGVPQSMEANWIADVYRHYGQVPYWTEKGGRSPMATDLYQITKLIGVRVGSPGGEVHAMLNNLVIDTDGRITLAILSDIKGRGHNLVAVPLDALSRTGKGTFALNLMGDQLASAPSFRRSDLQKREYAEHVYRFFGLQPSWRIGGRQVNHPNPYRWGGEAQDF